MTEIPPIDDDLLSAYLDDEVTATERATIEADPRQLARVAELRSVRDAVAAPVAPLSEGQSGDLIAAALAASTTSPGVTSLTAARAERSFNWRPLVAVAAAVAVIGVAIPVIRSADLGGDSADTATEAVVADEAADEEAADEPATEFSSGSDDSAADGDDEAASTAAAEPADQPAEEPAAEAVTDASDGAGIEFEPLPAELDDFTDVDDVVDRVREELTFWYADTQRALARNTLVDEPTVESCAEEFALEEFDEPTRSDVATATIAGVENVVYVFDDGRILIAPAATCGPLTEEFFEG